MHSNLKSLADGIDDKNWVQDALFWHFFFFSLVLDIVLPAANCLLSILGYIPLVSMLLDHFDACVNDWVYLHVSLVIVGLLDHVGQIVVPLHDHLLLPFFYWFNLVSLLESYDVALHLLVGNLWLFREVVFEKLVCMIGIVDELIDQLHV